MAKILQCEHGHSWEAIAGDKSKCPFCNLPALTTDFVVSSEDAKAQGSTPKAPFMASPSSLPELPGFEILDVLGRGGMGIVYRARQRTPDRTVAIKMIRSDQVDEADLHRFREESNSLAQLNDPNIVAIHEVSEHNGVPYFVMELVEGESLHQRLAGAAMAPAAAAILIETLARTMHRVHGYGILHRDLKPANILLAGDAPKITDFGLAKRMDRAGSITSTGVIVGTPSYMSPEQATGEPAQAVDCRADVYSLGAVLYECLTGRVPFKGASPLETVLQVLKEDPVLPRNLQPKLPRDLETICLKCLEKSPSKRYANAHELAEDVRRYRSGEPIIARPAGWIERGFKWLRRHPVAALTAVAALGVVGTLITLFFNGRLQAAFAEANFQRNQAEQQKSIADQERAQADTLRARAERQALTIRTFQYAGDMRLAQMFWQNDQVPRMIEFLNRHRPAKNAPDLRGLEWRYLWSLCHAEQFTGSGHTQGVRDAVFEPQGKWLATGSDDQTVRIWNPNTGKIIKILGKLDAPVHCIAVSPDGKLLAAGGGSLNRAGSIQIWNVESGNKAYQLIGHTRSVSGLAFSPDGKWIASAGGNEIRIWDTKVGLPVKVINYSLPVFSVVFRPDGKLLAAAGFGTQAGLWDTATWRKTTTLTDQSKTIASSIYELAFSPDGKQLAASSFDKIVRVWQLNNGNQAKQLQGHNEVVFGVDFSPDGRWLASCGRDKTIKVWDVKSATVAFEFKGHTDSIWNIRFSPNSRQLVSVSEDRTIKIWHMEQSPNSFLLQGHSNPIEAVALDSADGKLASGSAGQLKIWNLHNRKALVELNSLDYGVRSLCFHPNGQHLAAAGGSSGNPNLPGTINIFDVKTGAVLSAPSGHSATVTSIVYSPDGSRLATASLDKTIRIWDSATGKHHATLSGHTGPVNYVAFGPNGKRLASASGAKIVYKNRQFVIAGQPDYSVKIWDVATGKTETTLLGHTDHVKSVAFSPDGTLLVSGSSDQTVRVWNRTTGKITHTLRGHFGPVECVRFSRDGKRVISGGGEFGKPGQVKVWDIRTGQETLSLDEPFGPIKSMVLSRDGRRIVCSCGILFRGKVRVWRTK